MPEEVAFSCVAGLLCSLSSWSGCVPPGLQAHILLLMAASPEDVSRCKFGKRLTPTAIQLLRDVEAVWGLRFMIRRVEAVVAAPAQQSEDGGVGGVGGDRDEDDDDDDDEATPTKRQFRSQPVAAASPEDELVLSCRGVGVRGARKAM